MKRFILISLLALCALAAVQLSTQAQRKPEAQKPAAKPASPYGNTDDITAAQLKDYLYFVASDEMEGRNTPSRGLDLTAKFLALNLSRWGFKPAGTDGSFLQKFGLTSRQLLPDTSYASFGGQTYKAGEDFLARPIGGAATGGLVYVGYGYALKAKGINPYQDLDVRNKVLLVVEGMPKGVTFRDLTGKPGEDFDTPETFARRNGAQGIVYIPSSSTLNFWEQRHKSSLNPTRPVPEAPQTPLPAITASEKLLGLILQGEATDYETIKKQMGEGVLGNSFALGATKQISFTVNVKGNTTMTQNVVAILEGSDPTLKNEYVAVGAHYDHVGVGAADATGDTIFNGADDDGSGTVAVLAIAEALVKGPRPKRSILLVWHAGEEKGLWGSEFVTANPPVPREQIIAQLNIDMIGRSKKEGDTNPRNVNLTGPNEIYVIGSKMMSTELGALSETVNDSYLKLAFNYKYDAPNDPERLFFRSDHYNYAKRGIPIIFYFDGVHEDYHRQSDHADKIDYQKMEKVTRTIFATMWTLANNPSRPKVDKQLPAALMGN